MYKLGAFDKVDEEDDDGSDDEDDTYEDNDEEEEEESTADDSSLGGTPTPKAKIGWGSLRKPTKVPALDVSDSESETATPAPSLQVVGGGDSMSPFHVSESES